MRKLIEAAAQVKLDEAMGETIAEIEVGKYMLSVKRKKGAGEFNGDKLTYRLEGSGGTPPSMKNLQLKKSLPTTVKPNSKPSEIIKQVLPALKSGPLSVGHVEEW